MEIQITNFDSRTSLLIQAVKPEQKVSFYTEAENGPAKVRFVLRPGECENFTLKTGWVVCMEAL